MHGAPPTISLISNTVELIPTLGALFPRGGPVQDPVLTPTPRRNADTLVVQSDFFFYFTLVTGPRRSLSLMLSDARVYEPRIRARLGTTAL